MLLLTLRGTPLIYYGDEIGMTDVPLRAARTVDPDGRDPKHTPMQWGTSPAAGFSTGQPWLPIPPTAGTVNVAAQHCDPGSLTAEPLPRPDGFAPLPSRAARR